MNIDGILMQIPGLTPTYTKHPIFPDLFTAMVVAALIAIGLNLAFAILRKKTTDIERMSKIMKETNEWGKEYRDAIKKQDKQRIAELKKQQAYVNKMTMQLQQQQMRPMLIYMMPTFMLWIFVFPAIFGQTVAVSPIHIPYIMCSDSNISTDTQLDEKGEPKGVCSHSGEIFLWGWFLITSFATSGLISKVTKTSMPSMM